MSKMGQVVPIKLSKLEKKSLLKYIDENLKGLDQNRASMSEKEYELARKTIRHAQKRIRKADPGTAIVLDAVEYNFLKTSLERVVEYNRTAFKDMFFLKRWFYKLLSKNYEHLLSVVNRRGT